MKSSVIDGANSKKLRVSGNRANKDIIYLFSLSYEDTLNIYTYNLRTGRIAFQSIFKDIQDFDLIRNRYNLYVVTVTKNKFKIYCYDIRTFNLISDFKYEELNQKLPKIQKMGSLNCRHPSHEQNEGYDVDCSFQADDYKLYSLIANLTMDSRSSGRVTNTTFYLYHLPYLFHLGFCTPSRSFILCEMSIKTTTTIGNLTDANHLLESLITYPKINGPYSGNGFSSRMEIINKTYLCTNKNFAFSNSYKDTYVAHRYLPFSLESVIFEKTLNDSIDLLIDFNGSPDHTKVIDSANVTLSANLRYNQTVIFNSDMFEIPQAKPSDSSFVIVVILIVIIVALLTAYVLKGNDRGDSKSKPLLFGTIQGRSDQTSERVDVSEEQV